MRELLINFFQFCGPFLLENWSFIIMSFLLLLTVQVMKGIILNGGSFDTSKGTWRWYYKKSLPIHSALIGGILGILLQPLVPEYVGVTKAGAILYFIGSGVFATWLHSWWRLFAPSIIELIRNKIASLSEKK